MSTPTSGFSPSASTVVDVEDVGVPGQLEGVLWDMDGTLVDTEPYWIRTEFELVESFGGTWSLEHAHQLVGNALIDSARYIREHGRLPLEPEEIVERLLDGVVAKVRQEIPWRPGARELLADLGKHGIPSALVTMSWTRFVEPILEQVEGEGFAALVTGDSVTHGKPHPEPYLAGAAALGLEPHQCLAIEDSATGAASATAAGCALLAVPLHVPVPSGPRRVFAQTLAGLDAEALASIHRQAFAAEPLT